MLKTIRNRWLGFKDKYKLNNFVIYFSIALISCLLINYSLIIPLISFIGLFIYSLFDWKKKILIFLVVSILFISFGINYLLINLSEEPIVQNRNYRIQSIKNSYVVLVSKFKKYYVSIYDLDVDQLVLNRKLRISGELLNLDNLIPNNSYEFNFGNYLNKTGIKYQLKINNVEYLNSGVLFKLNKFYKQLFSSELSRIFILNDRTNSELINTTNHLALSYLFNFNGLAVFILSYLLQKGAKLARFNHKAISISQITIDSCMLLFCLTINLNFILTKTFLFLLVKNVFLLKRIKVNKTKLWIICFTLLISIHNEIFLNKTFYYYLVAIVFLRSSSSRKIWKQIIHNLVMCSLTFMVVNTMVDYRFYYFNEIFDLIFGPLFALESVFVYLTFWIPKINVVYEWILKINLNEMNMVSKINYYYATGSVPIYLYWSYFIGLYFLMINFWNPKINWLFVLVVVSSLIFIFVFKYLNQEINNKFILLDVGNGQTMIYRNRNETIFFDIGTGTHYSDNKIVSFLKYYGISEIDKLFISHYHSDHYSAVDKVIENEIKIKDVVKRENVEPLIRTKNLLIEIFNNELIDKNENNNSLVYLIKWNNKSLLIMSDLEKEDWLINSERFINKINNQSIDYMVLGHHGSKTSSSEQLLELVKPRTALISGHDDINRHFPDLETINKLEKLNIKYKTTEKFNDIQIS